MQLQQCSLFCFRPLHSTLNVMLYQVSTATAAFCVVLLPHRSVRS
jgi:hypothetical protein